MIVDSDSIRLLYILLFVHPVETGCIFAFEYVFLYTNLDRILV